MNTSPDSRDVMGRLVFILGITAAFALPTFVQGTSNENDRILRVESILETVMLQNEALARKVEMLEDRVKHLEEENKEFRKVIEDKLEHDDGGEADKSETETKQTEVVKTTAIKQQSQTKGKIIGGISDARRPAKRFLADFTGVTVAFTAVVSPSNVENLGTSQAIVFDRAITNIGGAYSNHSGVFTAPISGVYVFNFAVMVAAGEDEYVELVIDGSHVMWDYGHASSAPHYVSSSRTTTLEVNQGSQVWVRTHPLSLGTGKVHGNGFTTFSGWLLAQKE